MKIAHCVEAYAPSIGGMQHVVRQLSERMVRAGHEVTVFTGYHPERVSDTINGVHIRSYRVSGNAVNGLSGDVDRYLNDLINGAFDVVVLFAAQQWAADAVLPHLDSLSAAKIFVPTGFSALGKHQFKAYFELMPTYMKKIDMNIFLSGTYQDIEFAKKNDVNNITVIPNGADEQEFEGPLLHDVRSNLGVGKNDLLVVHIGSNTGQKGHWDAIRIFLTAERTKGGTLLLVGNGNAELERSFRSWRHLKYRIRAALSGRRVLIKDLDRERTVSVLRQADLFLFPSAIECSPLVLFESMAAGVPFLASNAGNSAEIVAWSQGGRLLSSVRQAEGWERVEVVASAGILDRMLMDRGAMRAMGQAGRAAWQARFTWGTIAQTYLKVYRDAMLNKERRNR
ncbi:MAG: glycosyltransferase family 4 protein [Flavobacteriales bacterium]|jgi:glycosyltransferase involved in cell wall biosynthesis|nr:glycosyltransferase family 4 protein [Flavobacteriales bacterium]